MKYAAAITLYNPTQDFIDNMLGYMKSFPLLIVNDNSIDNSSYKSQIENIEGIIYRWDGENYGLPKAFNESLRICEDQRIDYLCTLDQDSKLAPDSIEKIKRYIETQDMTNVGIVAPHPIEITSEALSKEIEKTKEVSWVICSGAFLNVKLLKAKGIAYDEAYFVDRFDADICMQIFKAGLKQLLLEGVEMPHACGDETGHSPLRNYYIFRNRFYYNDKYYGKLSSLGRSILQTIRHCWTLLINQKEGTKKIKMLPIAVKDYYKNKLGKISDSSLKKVNDICQEI